MERFTVAAATSNGSLSQRPMFKTNETSHPYTTSSFPPPKPQQQQHIDSSFSSYLRQSPPPPPQEPSNQDRITCRIVKGSEISIFEAEKYFNENQDQKVHDEKVASVSLNLDRIIDRSDIPSLPRLSSVSSVDGYGRNYRTGSFNATPTASSEASWNSQSGLLSNPPGSIAVSMRNLRFDGDKRKGSSSSSSSASNKWFFGRKCPCLGKKSVQVQQKFSGPKIPVLNRNSSATASRKQSSDAGEVSVLSSEAPSYQKPKEMDKSLGATDDRPKSKTVSANWVKEQETAVRDTGVFSPENQFPTDNCRRIVPSCRSFPESNGGGAFSFPILNPPQVTTRLVLSCPTKQLSQLEDPPRESLEVFRPVDESTLRKSMDLQRRVSMSFPEANDRRGFNFPASPKNRTSMDDDVVSDASSDLFEIESFSTQTTMYPMYRRRDSLDEISSYEAKRLGSLGGGILNFRRSLDETTTTASIAPTECYEPSEVSIDWSVTTAEGFDRASITNFSVAAASEYEENRYVNTDHKKITASNGNVNGASKQKGGTGLLSCRCEKAVNVGPNPVKFVPEQRHTGASYGIQTGRINPAMSRMSDITSMHVTRASAGKIPLVRSNSARMAHALAT